ncbi:MAG: proprotein convertase P-domain-containing protein [Bryobacterales bacterium]|nr:proprotein convertase P-domain-containing protein [Bryobacterales bacterium]
MTKRPDQFVVRAGADELPGVEVLDEELVSPHSMRITTTAAALDQAMADAREVAPAHHAYDVAETGQEFLITDRLLVTFKSAPALGDLDAFAAKYSLVKLQSFSDREFLYQLTDHTGMNPVKLVVTLTENEPAIERVDHDLNMRVSRYAITLPADAAYAREWHLHTHFANAEVDARSSSRCEGAWQAMDGFGSAEVVVGVTDDGCRLDHRDFDGPDKFAGWAYFQGSTLISNQSPGANPAKMYQTGADHGTACAGVIAAEVDGSLTVGAAPACKLFPVKWESSGASLLINDSKFLAALALMADKVDVISNSWGNSPDMNFSSMVINRVRQLTETGGRRGKGIVVLFAAGNENCPIQHSGNLDIPFTDGWAPGFTSWIGVETSRVFTHNLTSIPGVMHVAALASNAQRSHYSNYGTGIGITAPSSNVHEYQRVNVPGLGITTVEGTQVTTVTDSFGGTSSATPLVAGIAALVISANPALTAAEVLSILKRTAAKDLDFTPYPRTPPAAFDPDTSWDISPAGPFQNGAFQNIGSADGTWSPWFGHGNVNAQAAVVEALGLRADEQQGLRKSSAPRVTIPDNTPAGVRDSIAFTEAGSVSAVKVSVDITHTFIGDLVVTLTSPSGRAVTLHQRQGGSADNLVKTFQAADTPLLGSFAGETIAGAWTLAVADVASADVGLLNRWELELTAGVAAAVDLRDAPGLAIPDNNAAGVERTFAVTATGNLGDLAVGLDITHTYIGDLEVTLVSAAGTAVSLHNRAGGSADNIVKTLTPATLPALSALRGQPMAGTWKLKVADRDKADTGKLNAWTLRLNR